MLLCSYVLCLNFSKNFDTSSTAPGHVDLSLRHLKESVDTRSHKLIGIQSNAS